MKPTKPSSKETKKPAAAQSATRAPAESATPAPGKRDALAEWAGACVARAGGGGGALPERPASGMHLAVGRVFGLDEHEVALMQLCHAIERSFALARRVRELGGGGLTVELARAALEVDVDALLGPTQLLRRHALVTLAQPGPASAASVVRLGVGLAPRLEGRLSRNELQPFVHRIGAGALAAAVAGGLQGDARVTSLATELAREELPRLVTIAGAGRKEALTLALAWAQRLGRGLTFVDGATLRDAVGRWDVIAAARREADLDGELLVLADAAATHEDWRALAAPPATLAPQLGAIAVSDAGEARDVFLVGGWRQRAVTLWALPPAAQAAGSAPTATATPAEPPKPAPVDDGLDHIRKMAIRDAEAALGISRPSAAPLPRQTVSGEVTSSGLRTAAPPPVVAPPPPAPVAATPAPPPAASAAEPAKPKPKRSRKAMLHFGSGDDDAAPAAAAPRPAPAAAPAPAPAAAPAPDGALSPELAAAEALPFVEAPPNAGVGVLARLAISAPNPKQRIEILRALHGVKDPAAMAAMRQNAASSHPGLREVAAVGMALLFGPNWNVSRAVPKPVQPPIDDKDRGPPGGW